MMRTWLAVALLASSWLLGLGYFDPVNVPAWACSLAASVLLLSNRRLQLPRLRQRAAIVALLVPAVWYVPFPYTGIPLLLLAGVAFSLAPIPARWLRSTGHGAILAGTILLPQSIVLLLYQHATARSHELPTPLAQAVAALTRLLGCDATVDSALLVVRSASTTIRMSATWELLLAPGTVCLLAGGCLMITLSGRQRRVPGRVLMRRLLALLLIGFVWSALRTMLLVSVVLQQRLRATPVTYPNAGEPLISTWVHICLLIIFAALLGILLNPVFPRKSAQWSGHRTAPKRSHPWWAIAACGVGIGMLTFLYFWCPVGERKGGRIVFVERHSSWEPTTEPYGTKVYGEAGSYNYAAAYEYCGQYYEMARLLQDTPINDQTLSRCDVLIIKTPTSRYTRDEVAAVVRFVQQGGSLLLIGDHTNVFNMNTYLNDIGRRFGFTFRNDLLFQIGDPYRQKFAPPPIRHPILQHMPPMDFAVSCSIDPGMNRGTMVIRNVGLFNLPPAYHESNYHPQAEYRPYMQYGSWCQLWATSHGRGRIVAFADSTLFSNFCVFQPGKAELLIGMLEWLNHSSPFDAPASKQMLTIPLVVLSLILMSVGWRMMRGVRGGWLLWIAGALAAWTGGAWLANQTCQHAMPLPAKHHSMRHVVIDRTVSIVPLFTGAFADDPDGNGYGMLEQWIPRIGNYISRRQGMAAFQGDSLVLICPTRLPSQRYRDRLVEWVRAGGHLVVVDSPDLEGSTANSILMLFGLSSAPSTTTATDGGKPVHMVDSSPHTPLLTSCVISGGTPIAIWMDTPVAAQTSFGRGRVTAIGFGSLFNDANMGYHWLAEPDTELQARYELLYALLRAGI